MTSSPEIRKENPNRQYYKVKAYLLDYNSHNTKNPTTKDLIDPVVLSFRPNDPSIQIYIKEKHYSQDYSEYSIEYNNLMYPFVVKDNTKLTYQEMYDLLLSNRCVFYGGSVFVLLRGQRSCCVIEMTFSDLVKFKAVYLKQSTI